MSEVIEKSLQEYREIEKALPGRDSPWLRGLREEALQRFAERGYPTTRDEPWKYTNVAPIVKRAFRPAPAVADNAVRATLTPYIPADLDAHLLTFFNGRLAPGLSTLADLPAGVEIGGLADALGRDGAALQQVIGGHAPAAPNAFTELNTAFMTDGARIRLAPGAVVDRPIHLLYVTDSAEEPVATYVRNLIEAGRGSRAVVIEHYVSLNGGQALTNAVTQCVLEEGAAVEHYKLGEESESVYHIAGIHAHLGRDSRYVSHNISTGGRLLRNDIFMLLDGEGSECDLNGLYVGHGRQHMDNYTYIDHKSPGATSREWYKGVLDDEARGIFNGHVMVRQDAQQSDAQQGNHSLLLSEDAEADSRPQLEIYADDVKCSHGSTVGQLDPEALFYLRSRGMSERYARRMLVAAFAGDVLKRMALDPVRGRLEQQIAERLMH